MKTKTLLALSLISLLGAYLAFYNGYPLVTSDSGAYINNGFEIYLPADRPITYSLFLRVASLSYSLWLPIVLQSLLTTTLVCRLTYLLLGAKHFSLNSFTLIAVTLIGATPMSWYISQLMPDIFTAILIINTLLYFIEDLKKAKIVYLFLIFSTALMHNSNLLILLICAMLICVYTFFKVKEQLKNALKLVGIACFSLFFMASLHAVTGNGFTLSKASHVFLIGKLCENGLLKTYLDKNCAKNNYQLCTYKDNLPKVAWAFVWNEGSPLYKMGGWEATKTEYKQILKDIALSPTLYPALAYKSIEHTLRQLTQIQVGDGLFAYKENTNPFWKVQQYYPHELPEYLTSKQNASSLDWDNYNLLYYFFLLFSTIIVLLFTVKYPLSTPFIHAYFLVILFFVINAFITANFANVLARLSSRIIWLLPLINIIYLTKYWVTRNEEVV